MFSLTGNTFGYFPCCPCAVGTLMVEHAWFIWACLFQLLFERILPFMKDLFFFFLFFKGFQTRLIPLHPQTGFQTRLYHLSFLCFLCDMIPTGGTTCHHLGGWTSSLLNIFYVKILLFWEPFNNPKKSYQKVGALTLANFDA